MALERRAFAVASVLMAMVAGCADDVGCTGGAEVRDGVCKCPEGLARVSGVCVHDEDGSVSVDPALVADATMSWGHSDAGSQWSDPDVSTAGQSADGSMPLRDASAETLADSGAAAQSGNADDASAMKSDAGPSCQPAAEVCDGKDNDCDGLVDEADDVKEAPIGQACGNGGQGVCAAMGQQICFNGAIKCGAPPPTPAAERCDGVDNDCNGKVDEGLTNACGGNQCSVDLGRRGTPCSAGQGDCAGEGTWVCDATSGNNALRCDATEKRKNACGTSCGPVPAEDCNTPGDDNCDGRINEGCAPSCGQVAWYQDCDGDGYAASTAGSRMSCDKPAVVAGCASWTQVVPNAESKSNWDCADNSPSYRPGASPGFPPDGSANYDLNCNGYATPSDSIRSDRTSPRRCLLAELDAINRLQNCSGFPSDCYAWRDSGGKYVTLPPQQCPDMPYVIGSVFPQAQASECHSMPLGYPLYPCN